MTSPSLDDLARLAARVVSPAGQGKGRTVVRFDRDDLARLGTLRARLQRLTLDKSISRAAVVRVLVRWGLDMADAAAAPPPEQGGPT
jgi:hypothetical protein